MFIEDNIRSAIKSLEALQEATKAGAEETVQRFWDETSFENQARKATPADDRSATPNFHRPTRLSIQLQRKGDGLYMNWVVQDSRYKKKPGGVSVQPYKTHIPRGIKSDTYPESALTKHMSGWERDLVLSTEAKLGRARTILKTTATIIATLKRLEQQNATLEI